MVSYYIDIILEEIWYIYFVQAFFLLLIQIFGMDNAAGTA